MECSGGSAWPLGPLGGSLIFLNEEEYMFTFLNIPQSWYHTISCQLWSAPKSYKDLCDLQSQYHACWWPGDSKSPGNQQQRYQPRSPWILPPPNQQDLICCLVGGHLLQFGPRLADWSCPSVLALTGLLPGVRLANERRRYKVTPSLIGWVQI